MTHQSGCTSKTDMKNDKGDPIHETEVFLYLMDTYFSLNLFGCCSCVHVMVSER